MRISEQSQSLSRFEVFLLLFTPAIMQFLFSGLPFDFFLIGLFYIFLKNKLASFFFVPFFWGIIYYLFTYDNPGTEVIALGTVWYLLVSFRFESGLSKIIAVFSCSFLYVFMKLCIIPGGCVWNIFGMLAFTIFFSVLHTGIFILIMLKFGLTRDRILVG